MSRFNDQQQEWFDLMKKFIKEDNDQRLGELVSRLINKKDKDESLLPRAYALRVALQSPMNTWAVWRLVNRETAQHVDKDGYTALHVACFNGNIQGASYLIQCGAKLVRNKNGQTPIDGAPGIVGAAIQAMLNYQEKQGE